MKKTILFFLICIFSSPMVFGQCKVKSKGLFFEELKKFTPLEVEFFTKFEMLFDKYTFVASQTFVKTIDSHYYLVLILRRSYSSEFEVNEDTPLICSFEDNGIVNLYPSETINGIKTLKEFRIYLAYKLTKDQIETFAANNLNHLKIYFKAEKVIKNANEDDLGRYFEFEINNDKYRDKLFDAANCILQH